MTPVTGNNMRTIPLKLDFGLREYSRYVRREKTEGYSAFKQKILDRDEYTCCFCGFRAMDYMTVINADHNYRKNRAGNMFTACPLCAQCHFIEHIGVMENSGGTLIYYPEMTQAELNGFVHSLFCAIANATVHEQSAESAYNALKLRSKVVEEAYGEGRADPRIFGNMLINAAVDNTDELYADILKDLRVLAKINDFTEQIKTWSLGAKSTLEKGLEPTGN